MTQNLKTKTKRETKVEGLFQIVPHDEETGNQQPAPEEFNSIEEAEKFLEKTKDRWDGWKSIQIVEKRTGKVADVW